MKEKEFNLSDYIIEDDVWIETRFVKEFIKILKKDLKEIYVDEPKMSDIIDKRAGDDLK